MRQPGCPRCSELTCGDCGAHGPNVVIMAGGAPGTWRFDPLPQCVVCKRFGGGGDRLGYGSKFDGKFVCWECIGRVIDPALEKAGAKS